MSASTIVQATAIGASEIAAVLGISPYADRWTIYARKHGLIEPQEQTDEMFWGKKLEPLIAEVFAEKMNFKIQWHDQRVYSQLRPWQYASPDAFILTEPRQLLECKTAGLHQSGEWDPDAANEDGVPDYYVAQVEWQLSTTGLATAYIAVLIAGNDFRVYKIEHDPELEQILLDEGEAFWREYLLGSAVPPIGTSAEAHRYLRKRFPREREKLRPASEAEIELLNEYAAVKHTFDQTKLIKEGLENEITQAIGDHEGLVWPLGKFTWKRTKDSIETHWEALARSQLVGYSEDERADLIAEFTHPEPGHRRIHFREGAAK